MNPIFGVKGEAPDKQQVKTVIDKIRKDWKVTYFFKGYNMKKPSFFWRKVLV
jgi:hypothetical protein